MAALLGGLASVIGIGSMGLSAGLTIKDLLSSNGDEDTPYDPNVGTLKGKTDGSAGHTEQGAYGGQLTHLGAAPSTGSLGRPIALEDDPVLDQPVDNSNNFIF